MKKTNLQEAVRELREVYHDAIAARIQNTDKSYAEIGAELGCSEQTVFLVAKLRRLGRNSQRPTNTGAVAEAQGGGHHE
ncbi:MAG TPA: hypothetical protein VMR02_03290 [Terracidiphilus sp.]|jgi:hypothetical protein|nr:hypothetical protein [Terracidiphilus sp.]